MLAAAVLAVHVPVASQHRMLNRLTQTRESATTWRFFESLHEKRILIVTDRPEPLHHHGLRRDELREPRRQDPFIFEAFARRLFYDIYVVQQIKLSTNEPLPGYDIWPERKLETMLEFQNDADVLVRISRRRTLNESALLAVARADDVRLNGIVGRVGRIAGDDRPFVEGSLTRVGVAVAAVATAAENDRALLLHWVLARGELRPCRRCPSLPVVASPPRSANSVVPLFFSMAVTYVYVMARIVWIVAAGSSGVDSALEIGHDPRTGASPTAPDRWASC